MSGGQFTPRMLTYRS